MPGPLSHLTVIELAGIGPGPFACMMLADLGATVIRIDRLPGPPSRGGLEDLMRNDSVVDRGRRSVSVNMKDPRGVEAVLRLVERADILVEGFRPGVTEKLGLGPEPCQARNPAGLRPHDRLGPARSAGPGGRPRHQLHRAVRRAACNGRADRPPTPPLNLVGDYGGGGMLLVVGVLAACAEAQRSGQGQVVDAAMTDGAALLMAAQYGLMAKGFWQDRRESNFLDGCGALLRHVRLRRRPLRVGRRHRAAVLPPAAGDLRHRRPAVPAPVGSRRVARAPGQARGGVPRRARDEWCGLLEGTDACFAPVLSMDEAPAHPHNAARGTFVTADGVTQPAPAPRFDRTPTALPPRAPVVGGDTAQMLEQTAFTAEEIRALCEAGRGARRGGRMSGTWSPCGRRPLHLRRIHCEGFERDDGLIDLEGTLIDTKPEPLKLVSRVVPAGAPIHQMRVRLTIDRERRIVDVRAFSEATPYPDCQEIEAAYRKLVGLCIEPGFTQEVKRLFRGTAGCTHMTELLPALASTAFQVLWANGNFQGADEPGSARRTSPLGGCHALRLDGHVVRTYFAETAQEATVIPASSRTH